MNDSAKLLRLMLEEDSETCWAAGWMADHEWNMWAIIVGDRAKCYGNCEIGERWLPTSRLKEYHDVALRADGWWSHTKDFGLVFVPMDAWLEAYDEHKKEFLAKYPDGWSK